mmetsp:Transcript_28628/g.71991  ORF Transcript_28628/g.71991 Transcript_28628/m.71991 type:complete len:241 (+) Transcript_28628:621-1343(+)
MLTISAAMGESVVFSTALDAVKAPPSAAMVREEQALKDSQPNQRTSSPSATSAMEWPGISTGLPWSSKRPSRAPRITVMQIAAMPPSKWTTPLPAKSTTLKWSLSQPCGDHTQCATNGYITPDTTKLSMQNASKRIRSARGPEMMVPAAAWNVHSKKKKMYLLLLMRKNSSSPTNSLPPPSSPPNAKAKPYIHHDIMAMQGDTEFLSKMFLVFFTRTLPTSKLKNPHCMKNTAAAPGMSQ